MRVKFYEALGVRALYAAVAWIVREPTLPPSSGAPPTSVDKPKMAEIRRESRYFAAANLARAACYVPHFVAFLVWPYKAGLVYVIGLFVLHGIMFAVENYKTALCDTWAPHLPDKLEPKKIAPTWPTGWFALMSFETERFYRLIGMEAFRRFVTYMMNMLTFGFSGKKVDFIPAPKRSHTVVFELETRVSETVHFFSALTIGPLVWFSWAAAPLGVSLWSTVVVFGDLGLALLQRYHRVRVWPVLRRMLERKK
ncbi:MAG: hypothetical protein JST30_14750 [Armatimonadetes bacterium]|nr:hypothetical protein [Armatimonadota bacterium]